MWENKSNKNNVNILKNMGHEFIGPAIGDMACGEYGMGRMSEPANIAAAVLEQLRSAPRDRKDLPRARLAGKKALVTSGPTHEPLDPVRYIANRSSGRQGHAIAAALAALGAVRDAARSGTHKVLFAIDEYNALFGPTDMHEVLGARKRGARRNAFRDAFR